MYGSIGGAPQYPGAETVYSQPMYQTQSYVQPATQYVQPTQYVQQPQIQYQMQEIQQPRIYMEEVTKTIQVPKTVMEDHEIEYQAPRIEMETRTIQVIFRATLTMDRATDVIPWFVGVYAGLMFVYTNRCPRP